VKLVWWHVTKELLAATKGFKSKPVIWNHKMHYVNGECFNTFYVVLIFIFLDSTPDGEHSTHSVL